MRFYGLPVEQPPRRSIGELRVTITVVLRGVSGAGKSTVAAELASRLGWDLAEGDESPTPANTEELRSDQPLDDDRWPWLRRLADWIGRCEATDQDAVVTCSALKRSCRDLVRDGHPSVRFVHVASDPELIRARLGGCSGHYMPPSLLDSQLATLEPDEPGAVVPGAASAGDVADLVLAALTRERGLLLPVQEASS